MDLKFRDDLLDTYSDAVLIELIWASPSRFGASRIFYLSPRFIAKRYDSTAEIMDSMAAVNIASVLGIRHPPVRRIIMNTANPFTIMEKIPGNTLNNVWTKLSWWHSFKLALQLRSFVKKLRSFTSPTAGSLETGECRSFWLKDRFGIPAHSGPSEFNAFYRYWTNPIIARRPMQILRRGIPSDLIPPIHIPIYKPIPQDAQFVLTHHDLAPRNLLVSPSGELWLLDWDYAGYYPKSFEYAGMYTFRVPRDWGRLDRFRWFLFTLISVGYYEKDAEVLRAMRSKFNRPAIERRMRIVRDGIESRYYLIN